MSDLRIVVTILALLAAMVTAGVLGVRQRAGALILALLSIVWLVIDSDFEGAVLIEVSKTHGLTAADLVAVAGLVVAATQLALSLRPRTRERAGRP